MNRESLVLLKSMLEYMFITTLGVLIIIGLLILFYCFIMEGNII